jgi:hypothetical protein
LISLLPACGHRAIEENMSCQQPKSHLVYPRRQAQELVRSIRQGKLADAQRTTANHYSFATFSKLKAHTELQEPNPAQQKFESAVV